MTEVRRSAPSVEEAVEAALAELGLSEQEAEIQVVQEPHSGLFGVGAQEAIVTARPRAASEPPDADELDEQAEVGADFLEGLLEHMGIAASVETTLERGTMYIDVLGPDADDEDMGLLIGRRGQTLEAVQELVRVVVAQHTGLRPRVMVDVQDYRRRQIDRLELNAREVAERVARSGRAEPLEPMNPFLRKVIHDAVAATPGAESISEGEGPDRHVVIRPAR